MGKNKIRFYKNEWFLWTALVLCPIIGFLVLWFINKNFSKIKKIILTIVFLIWFFIFAGYESDTNIKAPPVGDFIIVIVIFSIFALSIYMIFCSIKKIVNRVTNENINKSAKNKYVSENNLENNNKFEIDYNYEIDNNSIIKDENQIRHESKYKEYKYSYENYQPVADAIDKKPKVINNSNNNQCNTKISGTYKFYTEVEQRITNNNYFVNHSQDDLNLMKYRYDNQDEYLAKLKSEFYEENFKKADFENQKHCIYAECEDDYDYYNDYHNEEHQDTREYFLINDKWAFFDYEDDEKQYRLIICNDKHFYTECYIDKMTLKTKKLLNLIQKNPNCRDFFEADLKDQSKILNTGFNIVCNNCGYSYYSDNKKCPNCGLSTKENLRD